MTSTGPSSRIYVLSTQTALTESLRPLLKPHDVQLAVFEEFDDLVLGMLEADPDIVVLDLALMPDQEDELKDLCNQITKVSHRRPSLVGLATAQERSEEMLSRRLAARRAGLVSYLPGAISARRLAGRLLALCGFLEVSRYHILVMVQNLEEGRQLAHTLAGMGMKTLVVDDPAKLLARLMVFRPNLLLMDMHFSSVSGIELATIIRDDEQFHALPILFLTDDSDSLRQLWALRVGGDGFIAKSARRETLWVTIEHQLRQSRWFRDRRTLSNRRENARGFLPRDVFMAYLERLLQHWEPGTERQGLLLIDLDAGQALLERLGHGGFERLLRELEQLLGQHLNVNEAATRLGDFRYAVLAHRDGPEKLQALADQIHEHAQTFIQQDTGKSRPVRLSIGVAAFDPPPESLQALLSRAEQVVQNAGQAGGDRVHVWSPINRQGRALMSATVVKRLVKTALQQDGLRVLFQPILPVDPHDEGLYEAQIRLRALDQDELSPADFLAVAMRAELMPQIDRALLQRIWRTMEEWPESDTPPRLLVHQSLDSLTAPDWFAWFSEQQRRIAPFGSRLVLEFQIHDIRRRAAEAGAIFKRLAEQNIAVCAASVTGREDEAQLLAQLGVRLAKLTIDAGQGADQGRLANAIQVLQAEKVAVIVPGIDGPDDLRRVWMCRPEFIQGHYLQLPSPDLNFDFQTLSDESR